METLNVSGRELARRAGCTEGAVRQLIRGEQTGGTFRGLRTIAGRQPLAIRVQRVLGIPDDALRVAIRSDDAEARAVAFGTTGPLARATDPLLRRHRKQILTLAKSHGATHVRVFGSRARGDARPDSDVDLLVTFDPGRSLIDQSGLILDLQELLERSVDVVTENGLYHTIRERVLAEAVPL